MKIKIPSFLWFLLTWDDSEIEIEINKENVFND